MNSTTIRLLVVASSTNLNANLRRKFSTSAISIGRRQRAIENSNQHISAISTATTTTIRFLSSSNTEDDSCSMMKTKQSTKRKLLPNDGVTLSHFTQASSYQTKTHNDNDNDSNEILDFGPIPTSAPLGLEDEEEHQ